VGKINKSFEQISLDKPIYVTFIVIAFNESNGIVNCISSILNQNVKESMVSISVLVVDDGSTDGTADLVEKSFSSKVKVLRQENAGRGPARLKGIETSQTPLIAMVDSDIRLPIDWLSICLENLDTNAGVGGVAVPDGDCATIQRIFHLTPKVKRGSIYVTGNNALYRTDAIRESGRNWVTPLGEDFRLNQELQARGFKLKRIDNLVVHHIESKSFNESLTWLYKSGLDATRLWLEFKITRVPDIATVLLVASLISIPILVTVFSIWYFSLPFIFILVVGFCHLVSKFKFRNNYLGFFAAWLPNTVLMLSYFLGRIVGIAPPFNYRIER
jgi:glycosyltransferase involved in cell wall biosynthesis